MYKVCFVALRSSCWPVRLRREHFQILGSYFLPHTNTVILLDSHCLWYYQRDWSFFSWAPKLPKKCESKHWLPCGADGWSFVRSVGKRSTHICKTRLIFPRINGPNVLGSGEPYQFEPPVLEEKSYASNDSFDGLKRERMIHFLYQWLLSSPGGGEGLPYINYTGMCRPRGSRF